MGPPPEPALSPTERERLAAIRAARDLPDLVGVTGADSARGAYLEAKREWFTLRGKELSRPRRDGGIPGDRTLVGDTAFTVHGVTHADTEPEREFLRTHVSRLLEEGATVYCEQGVRPMYFADLDDVCQMDDYAWAIERSGDLDVDRPTGEEPGYLDDVIEAAESLSTGFRDGVYALIDSGSEVYGEANARSLGDLASRFLMSHEDAATVRDFRAFRLTEAAASDPSKLADLLRYYDRAVLPQPIERAWLRRHDPAVELLTHARNGRMADYAVHHADGTGTVHVVVGAAHVPGVRYYLERHRDGDRSLDGFELVG